MQNRFLADLQLFAADESAPAAAETASGAEAADAGQQNPLPDAPETALPAERTPARRSWEEIRAEYKDDFDAEVQSIIQKRLRGVQDRLRRYAEREERERSAGQRRRSEAGEHFERLCEQAEALREKLPDFDLARELRSDAFASLTQPGSPVTLEQAYRALHPELRLREAEAVARRAAEAVGEAVRAGAARPRENGAQSASLASPSHRGLSPAQREELRRRIYAAGARGDHLPAGG